MGTFTRQFTERKSQLTEILASHTHDKHIWKDSTRQLLEKLAKLLDENDNNSEGYDQIEITSYETSRKNWKKNLELGPVEGKRGSGSNRFFPTASKRGSLIEERKVPPKRFSNIATQKFDMKAVLNLLPQEAHNPKQANARKPPSRSFLHPSQICHDKGYNMSLFPVKSGGNGAGFTEEELAGDPTPHNKLSVTDMVFRKDPPHKFAKHGRK
jgi:hypothetical protein